MLNKLTVVNYLGDSVCLDLRDPEKSGFLIYNITGIGPSKATINSTEMSVSDGSVYNSAKVESRNIVISMLLLERPTIEDTRHLLYKYFPVKKKVTLIFETETRSCSIIGYVESNEIPIFVKQESAQISIICPDPYFYSVDKTVTEFYSVEGGFEFPFSNESFSKPLLQFGIINVDAGKTVMYDGDGEVGIIIDVHATGDVSNISIFNINTKESVKISSAKLIEIVGSDIIRGDDIIISSIRGDKYIELLRAGQRYNILNALDRDADWFTLAKGENIFAYTVESGYANVQFTITNQTLYEGV